MEKLPPEMVSQIMTNLDNRSLMKASQVSRLYYRLAKEVAISRYRELFNRDPSETGLLKILRLCNPVKLKSNLFRNNSVLIGGADQISEENDREAFVGAGDLHIFINLGDVLIPGRPSIHVVIDMSQYGGILFFSDFISIIEDAVYERFIIPLRNGDVPILHGIERSFLNGTNLYYSSIKRQQNGAYFIDLTD
jgi:hypothetical protein